MNLCKNVLIYEIHESQTRLILDPSTRISGKNHVLKIKKKKKIIVEYGPEKNPYKLLLN